MDAFEFFREVHCWKLVFFQTANKVFHHNTPTTPALNGHIPWFIIFTYLKIYSARNSPISVYNGIPSIKPCSNDNWTSSTALSQNHDFLVPIYVKYQPIVPSFEHWIFIIRAMYHVEVTYGFYWVFLFLIFKSTLCYMTSLFCRNSNTYLGHQFPIHIIHHWICGPQTDAFSVSIINIHSTPWCCTYHGVLN